MLEEMNGREEGRGGNEWEGEGRGAHVRKGGRQAKEREGGRKGS